MGRQAAQGKRRRARKTKTLTKSLDGRPGSDTLGLISDGSHFEKTYMLLKKVTCIDSCSNSEKAVDMLVTAGILPTPD